MLFGIATTLRRGSRAARRAGHVEGTLSVVLRPVARRRSRACFATSQSSKPKSQSPHSLGWDLPIPYWDLGFDYVTLTPMGSESLLPQVLFFFGVGFFAANIKVIADLLRFRSRRISALLVWQNPKPPYYGFAIALGAVLGLLVAFKMFILGRPPNQLFGEVMMFVYYAWAFPLSTRIARGFYRDGVWSDNGFMRWGQISAVSWKEEGAVTLVLISHFPLCRPTPRGPRAPLRPSPPPAAGEGQSARHPHRGGWA